ncbi:MAG: beta-N-acetylhexosaminidase [Bacteroidetes bacterium HGW-Bacteroidetes-10]|nr:MAG: beta-N-acetylhexosaminidase [Bacteroidetes bacterium HGW-Bacteroidetes-10]
MKSFKTSLILFLFLSMISNYNLSASGNVNIVPKPVSAVEKKGHFVINSNTKIVFNFSDEHNVNIASPLNAHISKFYGMEPLAIAAAPKMSSNSIFISLNKKSGIKPEGYLMDVSGSGVSIEASTPAGLFYAVQSLIQLMPAEEMRMDKIKVPYVSVEDYPRFEWRGLHLDVCRHFMPKEFVLKYIDYMAMHKLNTFHFHLTEDQGWRIEIKRYPRLTEIGSKRKETIMGRGNEAVKLYDGKPHGGFYTQEDIKEIVAYAAKRYVTVVPEIEMPGHALAALAAYPELGCTGGPYEVATKWGVFKEVMCAGKEGTFEFLQNVMDEVLALFPSKFIHIGGDECPKESWKECPDCQQRIKELGLKDEHELQSWFITRMEKYLNAKGRDIIGWDEILEGGLAPNAAVMSWRGEAGGIAAAKERHKVVMSPGTHCYLDHFQGAKETQPLAIGGFTPLEKIYSYEPVPAELSAEEAKYIMGAQGNVWTEFMPNPAHVEYMVYPRAAALAEVVWSPKESRDYKNFKERMEKMVLRYYSYGINFCRLEFQK